MNDNARRRRSRYAPDDQVKRALRLAREEGLKPAGFTLDAAGGVTVLDSSAGAALAGGGGDQDEAEAELAACREAIAAAAPAGR